MSPEFEVLILGNTSSIPMHGTNHTAQVIRFGQEFFLLDCGEGTQLQLRKYKARDSKISTIFISHLHGDHYLGLIGLLSSYHLSKRTAALQIFGPRGLNEIITTHFRWSNTRLNYSLKFTETSTSGMVLLLEHPQFRVSSFPLQHRIPTTGFLIEEKEGPHSLIKEKLQENPIPLAAIQSLQEGKDYVASDGNSYKVVDFCHPHPPLRSYAFCSDTAFSPELRSYFAGVDLLYHESTFMEAEQQRAAETFHSTAKQAAHIAQLSGAKKLLLGHFSTRYSDLSDLLAEAQTIFPNSCLSEEGITYTIPTSHA
ncbi:MAG: ribonuclease Z [Bacteroidetes bacterium]|nr:ribonuclease Z [Bacteroidota bacterium]MDA1268727.1 ribonuclease Z [Bacteroidota bacterium]